MGKHSKSKKAPARPLPLRQSLFDRRPISCLVILFALSAAIRFLLSLASVNMPIVYIDEGLYVNIARSLFTRGEVLYRAQPISYVYLAYPIALLPLFLLPSSVSLYRAVQVWNALLMSSAVFPAYLLGKKLELSQKRSLLLALFTALVPEMALSSFLTAESLYYPMMVWAFAFAAAILTEGDRKKKSLALLLFGCFTGVIYFAKPVCVIFGVCFFLIDGILSLRRRDKANALFDGLGLVSAGAVILIGYLLYRAFFGEATLLNLYEKQFSDTSSASVPIMLQSVVYHAVGFVFACGGAYVLLPWFQNRNYSAAQRELMLTAAVGAVAGIIGVAVTVVPYQYGGEGLTSPVHLRYLMFFFPLFAAFFLSERFSGKLSRSRAAAITLLVFAALSVFPGAYRFYNHQAGVFDSPSLDAFYDATGRWVGILLTVVSVVCVLAIGRSLLKKEPLEKLRKGCCVILVLFFTVNGICSYSGRKTADKSFEKNAALVAAAVDGRENVVVITTNAYNDPRGFLLDSHLREPLQTVVMDDLLLNTAATGGRWASWTPYVQSPNTHNDPIIEVDTLLFDLTTADYVEFTENVRTTEIGDYVIAELPSGEPFLKSAIAGMDGFLLRGGTPASLLVFDDEILSAGEITLYITLRSSSGSAFDAAFASGGQSTAAAVDAQEREYAVTLPVTGSQIGGFTISAPEDLVISEYHTARS